jgi:hypothetical protein
MPALLRSPTIGSRSATISAAARRTLAKVRQVARYRHSTPAPLLDRLLHLGEPSAVATDQDDGTVLGQLERNDWNVTLIESAFTKEQLFTGNRQQESAFCNTPPVLGLSAIGKLASELSAVRLGALS